MPPNDNESKANAAQGPIHGKAIIAHGLMLLNLLFPLVLYAVLTVFWWQHRRSSDTLLFVAVNQAWIAATVSSLAFVAANALIWLLATYKSTFALITFEVYFIVVVPVFLIPGLLGLVKSNSNSMYLYPWLGRRILARQAKQD